VADDQGFADAFSLAGWCETFHDPCTEDWHARWFLDGKKGVVSTSEEGMRIDATGGFAVLWTHESFAGDLRIEYDFQRLDTHDSGVNILYIQATGDGQGHCEEDISAWSDRRRMAAMRDYFQNMHTYHLSYAAFPKDYIRGRRYLPERNDGLRGTKLQGEVFETEMFNDGTWMHITIVKRSKEIYARFSRPEKTLQHRFVNIDKPGIEKGRIGLRLMPGRASRFRDFRIYNACDAQVEEE
jgi:hypothetical protein